MIYFLTNVALKIFSVLVNNFYVVLDNSKLFIRCLTNIALKILSWTTFKCLLRFPLWPKIVWQILNWKYSFFMDYPCMSCDLAIICKPSLTNIALKILLIIMYSFQMSSKIPNPIVHFMTNFCHYNLTKITSL